MLNKPLPCIDCITFPICLNRYRNYRLNDINKGYKYSSVSKTLARITVKEKCCILSTYMHDHENIYGLVHNEFKKLFEDESWEDG